jgi:hypothetical protein
MCTFLVVKFCENILPNFVQTRLVIHNIHQIQQRAAPRQNETEQIHPVHRPLPPRSRAAASRPPPRLRTGWRDQRLKEGRRPDRGDRSEEGSRHRAITAMELLSCVGRVLFASFFIISAYREYVRPSPLPPSARSSGRNPVCPRWSPA